MAGLYLGLLRAVHSRFHILSAASSMTAADSSRIAAATTASSCAGVHTLGLAGQRMMTTAGVSSASISSTVMVSAAVIWLDAKGVTLDTENRFPFRVGSPRPSGVATSGRAAYVFAAQCIGLAAESAQQ
jgi:hypothetical protein